MLKLSSIHLTNIKRAKIIDAVKIMLCNIPKQLTLRVADTVCKKHIIKIAPHIYLTIFASLVLDSLCGSLINIVIQKISHRNGKLVFPTKDKLTTYRYALVLMVYAQLCEKAGIEPPRLYVKRDLKRTIFTLGFFKKNANIVVSDDMIRNIDLSKKMATLNKTTPPFRIRAMALSKHLTAVFAHELSHIKNHDIKKKFILSTITNTMITALSYLVADHLLQITTSDTTAIFSIPRLAIALATAGALSTIHRSIGIAYAKYLEYRADKDAVMLTSKDDIKDALNYLNAPSYKEPQDHPSIKERIMAIEKLQPKKEAKKCGTLLRFLGFRHWF